MSTFSPEAMDAAAEQAEEELRHLVSQLAEPERRGYDALFAWWARHKSSAGHRRLYRVAVKVQTQQAEEGQQ